MLKNLLKARQDNKAHSEKMLTFLEGCGGQQLTAEQEKVWTGLEVESKRLGATVATLEAEQAAEDAHAQGFPDGSPTKATISGPTGNVWEGGRAHKPKSARCADLFADHPANATQQAVNAAFSSEGAFYRAVAHGQSGPGLHVLYGGSMHEGSGPAGGFITPDAMRDEILDGGLEEGFVRKRALNVAMTGPTYRMPAWDDGDRSGGITAGGLSAVGVAELGTITEKTPKLREILLVASKVGYITPASRELLEDTNVAGALTGVLGRGMGFNMQQQYLFGSGASEPLGVLNSGATISIAKEVGQLAGTILHGNVVKMYARMQPASINKAEWFVSPSATEQLLQLSIALGTAGAWYPALREDGSGSFTLLGRPVTISEQLSQAGTRGDILFADFSKYVVGIRREITIDTSMHVGFAKEQVLYRTTARHAGQPIDAAPITPANGTDTLSAFVTLDTRA